MYALYIGGIVLRYLGVPLALGNSHEGASDCVSALQGVKRGKLSSPLVSSLSSILVSLFNGSNRFVIGIMSAAS